MNSAAPTLPQSNQSNSQQSQPLPPSAVSQTATIGGKEQSPHTITNSERVSEISEEIVLPKEVEQSGVVKFSDRIELPPDVKKLGVTQSGPSVPVLQTSPPPQVILPISDDQVVQGLHAQVTAAIKWLAVWCIKRLQKAHIALKVIHGKIVRVSTGG